MGVGSQKVGPSSISPRRLANRLSIFPVIGSLILGAGPGLVFPARGEARTSGIPRENSEELSGAGLGDLAFAYFRRRSAVKCLLGVFPGF